jgi:two-component sensor histidine kinase
VVSATAGPEGASCLPRCTLCAIEAIQRAYDVVSLSSYLSRRTPCDRGTTIGDRLEARNFVALATTYRALEIEDEDKLLGWTDTLRTIARGPVELFGSTASDITVQTKLAPLSLLAPRRRALVLACSALVINSIRHPFHCPCQGSITMALVSADQHRARLTVTDDGVGMAFAPGTICCGVAADLALLLDSDVATQTPTLGGTIAEINFTLGRCRNPNQRRVLSYV